MTKAIPDNRVLCTPSSEIYEYSSVNSEANEIRVAHILPGIKTDPLICKLEKVLLDDNPKYDTLSYTWGTMGNCVSLSINGKQASISRNLESALRRLRMVDAILTIWVDSICINQSDLVERSAQASKMRFIYRKASSVSVWLGNGGEQEEEGILASRILRDLDISSEDIFNEIVGDSARFLQFQALKGLFRRPYWFRIWVVQEVTVGQSAIIYWP